MRTRFPFTYIDARHSHSGGLDGPSLNYKALPFRGKYYIYDDFGDLVNLDEGLVGYWKFDEGSGTTVQDSSPESNDGNIFGSTWTSDAVLGNALDFDGSDDYVSVPNSSSLNPSREITLTAWIKIPSYNHQGVISKGVEAGAALPYFLSIQDAGELRLGVCNTSPQGFHDVWGSTVPLNQWVFVAGTFSTDGRLSVYINGEHDNSAFTSATGIRSNTEKVYIGCMYDAEGGTYGFSNGIIDEVRIYNRALSPREILHLYSHPSGTPSVVNSLQSREISSDVFRPSWSLTSGSTVTGGGLLTLSSGNTIISTSSEASFGVWELKWRWDSIPTTKWLTFLFLYEDSQNNWRVECTYDGSVKLQKVVGGVSSYLVTGSYTVDTSFHTLRVERDEGSDTWNLYFDDTLIGTATDSDVKTSTEMRILNDGTDADVKLDYLKVYPLEVDG